MIILKKIIIVDQDQYKFIQLEHTIELNLSQ